MILYVPNTYGIHRFVKQTSVTKHIHSSFKFTTNMNIAGRQGATKSINSIDLTSKKTVKTVEILNGRKYQ